jgi:hypothetical protein
MDEHYALRDSLVADLERDIVGPGATDETITDPPLTTYLAGVLHPASDDTIPAEEDRDLPEDDAETGNAPEPQVALSTVRYPSSLGVTFSVDLTRARTLHVQITAAAYVPLSDEDEPLTDQQIQSLSRDELLKRRWQRRALSLAPQELQLEAPPTSPQSLGNGLELYVRVRRDQDDTVASVTLALINRLKGGKVRDLDARFQCRLAVTSPEGDVFVERATQKTLGVDDEDLRSYGLLYRHAKTFAVGHGCAARWEGDDPSHMSLIASAVVPSARVRVAESNPKIISPALSLKRAAGMPKAELIAELRSFCTAYSEWIAGRRDEAARLDGDLPAVATEHLDRCAAVADRMLDGVDLLEDEQDPDAFVAFRLMLDAMLQQRARTDWLRAGGEGAGPSLDDGLEWRPFQLAFILLCLRGVADPKHGDRRVADLLWFPTGGGKTEAYLGLMAFVIFLRRLRGGHGGVTAIMRYTLRLLTIQQFARATLLICCCEAIRRRRDDLGESQISIGLWVGEAGTPNTREDARKALDKLQRGATPTKGNPKQLSNCPWCGRFLDSTHYWMGDHPPRLAIGCRNPECEFNKGLPVYVIDEDLYDYRPSLIVATSDKFASLPWREQCRALFNLGTDDPPPELIVQDELHLISGPLGTLAGLYETAVDLICESEGPRPKVIASTATIRRAHKQTAALFDRDMVQFPPPGIDARDSYFAVEASSEQRGDRMYVGLLSPASSHATLMIRTYARLLQSALESDVPNETKDAYWTLLGYFNSLRVLGGALLQVQDDVVDRTMLLAGEGPARITDEKVIEMTSRIESGDIPRHLALMDQPVPDAVDVVLATNMISVGVDVDRLGLMVVMGQPQTTSEYIQATSRVGRRHPGLVVVLYNGARSRDRSHYESFVGYHGALYRQVESTSVTPFSSRARDRALHAVLVAVARLTIPGLLSNAAAGAVGHHLEDMRAIRDRIVERVTRTMPEEAARTHEELDGVIALWHGRADENPDLVYADWKQPTRALLVDASEDGARYGAFETLFSLRDVDAECSLELVR